LGYDLPTNSDRRSVSLLSKHCSASTLIKRLGSYEQQHPVIQALKELDKILKTEYLLQYMDDVSLRQIIQKQLNKGENVNKFARAISWGNSGEIKFASKAEQLLVDVCRRLIQNTIIAWNYLYMSNESSQSKSYRKKEPNQSYRRKFTSEVATYQSSWYF
jgi:TnpA family transposase